MSIAMKMKFALLCLIALVVALPAAARSHPHVWTDFVVHPTFNAQGLEGFLLEWTFDEMFSMQIMEMVGLRAGNPSAAQVRQIREEAFDNLRHHNYFVHIWVDGERVPVGAATGFNARVKDNRIIYDFFIPCAVEARTAPRSVRFQVRDPEIFVDFTMSAQEGVRIVNPSGLGVDFNLEQDGAGGFGGFFAPKLLNLQFRKAS